MKQPQLGQRIQEWRKAKGWTQEELVEKCSLNVRTLQRIEAGEVSPRPFTIKAIMEALEINQEEMSSHSESTEPDDNRWFQLAFLAGTVYLLTTMVEFGLDFTFYGGEKVNGLLYASIKAIVMVGFSGFMWGFYKLGEKLNNKLMQISSALLAVGVLIFTSIDIYKFFILGNAMPEYLPIEAVVFGGMYVIFGLAFINERKQAGTLFLISGILGVVVGIGFLSVIFALPSLFILAVFEILCLVLLYQEGFQLEKSKFHNTTNTPQISKIH
ncbi:helix-turn-helix domain-containing protein [Litoribacter alkaliphilus]|uniref:Helix-turn-helix domain-containing protein n=1 Tax=Litoribacter ruber TaxID=702568 RepID=A0AAP2G409_9BACT|nr:helix-turn-helix transcriptional regulator [Litoribacter alkaliphilus]MBS9522983.1 helix-turn-helix domain-containing protein [Litoribacter alkaliphilus]